MASRARLNSKQLSVLRRVEAGAPDGVFSDGYHHRVTARALASHGLISIRGRGSSWTAALTELGRQCLGHPDNRLPGSSVPEHELPGLVEDVADTPSGAARRVAETEPRTDAATRAMRRTRSRSHRGPSTPKTVERKETYMRYKVVVTRVQVAERWVRATDDEDAATRVQAEFDRPYGFFGSWKTLNSEVEVVEAEQVESIGPSLLSPDGPMLLSIKDAAKALGITYSALYELTNRGDIEHTRIGSRKFISRESLMSFIKENTYRGYR